MRHCCSWRKREEARRAKGIPDQPNASCFHCGRGLHTAAYLTIGAGVTWSARGAAVTVATTSMTGYGTAEVTAGAVAM